MWPKLNFSIFVEKVILNCIRSKNVSKSVPRPEKRENLSILATFYEFLITF
jgi:hypothetical protein